MYIPTAFFRSSATVPARNESLPQLSDLFVFKEPDDGCLPLIVGPPCKMDPPKTSYKKGEITPLTYRGEIIMQGNPFLFRPFTGVKTPFTTSRSPTYEFLNIVLPWANRVWSVTSHVRKCTETER